MQKDLVRVIRADRAVLRHLTVCLLAAVSAGLLVLVQAELLAGVLSGRYAAGALPLLVAASVARAALVWAQGTAAARTATGVKSALRGRLARRFAEWGPTRLSAHSSGKLVTLGGRGLDALDPYLTGYLPAVAVAAVVPVAVLVRLLTADLLSAVVVVVTLPLIPLFGALVGFHTKSVTEQQWQAMSRLGGHFLDAVRGLSTLQAFGRAGHQATVIGRIAEEHRSATMRTLRVAFLSSLVLELAASLSLALLAVPVGLRLLNGDLDLSVALLVLLLAPEAYLPLRLMGTQFHAAMEGVAVAEETFALLDDDKDAPTGSTGPAGRSAPAGPPGIRLSGVTVRYPGRAEPALNNVSLTVAPGERVALVGASGAGKSTLLHLLTGFVTPESGSVLVGGTPLGEGSDTWGGFAFVPQRPHLFATSIADNIRLGAPHATDEEVRAAAAAAHAAEFIEALPQGYATRTGERGADLSAGQRQRLALARVFCGPAAGPVLLDEPTARLDSGSETAVVTAARALMAGRTAVIVAHRPAMIALADRVVRLHEGRIMHDSRVVPDPPPVPAPPSGGPAARPAGSVATEDGAA